MVTEIPLSRMAVALAAMVDPDYALFGVVQKVGIKVYVCNIVIFLL